MSIINLVKTIFLYLFIYYIKNNDPVSENKTGFGNSFIFNLVSIFINLNVYYTNFYILKYSFFVNLATNLLALHYLKKAHNKLLKTIVLNNN